MGIGGARSRDPGRPEAARRFVVVGVSRVGVRVAEPLTAADPAADVGGDNG